MIPAGVEKGPDRRFPVPVFKAQYFGTSRIPFRSNIPIEARYSLCAARSRDGESVVMSGAYVNTERLRALPEWARSRIHASERALPPEDYQNECDYYRDNDHPDDLFDERRAGNACPEYYTHDHKPPVEMYACEKGRERQG